MTPPPSQPAVRLHQTLGMLATWAGRMPRTTLLLAGALVLPLTWAALPLLRSAPAHMPAWPLATVLLGAWLVLRMRQPLVLLLVVAPSALLAVALAGFAELMLGRSALTGPALALATALACQHGAMLLDRVLAEHARGRSLAEGLHVVWHHTGQSTTTGTAVAIVPFFALGVSPSSGLRDAGALLGTAMAASLVLHATVLPALLHVLAPAWARLPAPRPHPRYAGIVRRHAPWLLGLSVLAALLAVAVAPHVPLVAGRPTLRVQGVPGLVPGLAAALLVLWWLLRDLLACAVAVVPLLLAWCGLGAVLPLLPAARFAPALLPFVAVPSLLVGVHWAQALRAKRPLDRTLGLEAHGIGQGLLAPALAWLAVAATGQPGVRELAVQALAGTCLVALAGLVTLPAGLALLELRGPTHRVTAPGAVAARPGRPLDAPVRQILQRSAAVLRTPRAPGTFGALVAMPVAAVLSALPFTQRATAAAVLTLVCVAVARRYLRDGARDGPPQVVVDEFAGCLWALICVPWQPTWVIVVFLAFRGLGAWAPWPVRRVGALPGAWGVVADDLVAGVLAGAASAALRWAVA